MIPEIDLRSQFRQDSGHETGTTTPPRSVQPFSIDSPRHLAILKVITTLTKEYFDERLGEVEKNIEKKIEDEVHGLAKMVAEGFHDIAKRLDVKDRIEQLEKKMAKVESALNVQL